MESLIDHTAELLQQPDTVKWLARWTLVLAVYVWFR